MHSTTTRANGSNAGAAAVLDFSTGRRYRAVTFNLRVRVARENE
jgi:hypothetical protein